MTFARWPEWSVTAARERARELRRMVDAEGDPLGERSRRREAPRFQDLIDRYIKEHVPRLAPGSAADQKSMLAKLVAPHWGRKLVTEITKAELRLEADRAQGAEFPGLAPAAWPPIQRSAAIVAGVGKRSDVAAALDIRHLAQEDVQLVAEVS